MVSPFDHRSASVEMNRVNPESTHTRQPKRNNGFEELTRIRTFLPQSTAYWVRKQKCLSHFPSQWDGPLSTGA